MRRHELRTAKGYLEALIQANQDCHWWIEGIVTPIISEDGKHAHYEKIEKRRGALPAEEPHLSRRFSSDDNRLSWDPSNFPHCFGWQEAGCCEDDYHGEMLFPIEGGDGEYLLIGFTC